MTNPIKINKKDTKLYSKMERKITNIKILINKEK